MTPTDTHLLITKYLDDTASAEELAELNKRLANSAEAREAFLFHGEIALQLNQGQSLSSVSPLKPAKFSRKTWLAAWVGLAAVLTAMIILLSSPPADTPLARLQESRGQVEMPQSKLLKSGDTVRTIGALGFASFVLDDGTLLTLAENTIATLLGEGQKRLLVHRGSARLEVMPQPEEAPLVITTPNAELTVKGTSLRVACSNERTHLEVTEGLVALARLSDGQEIMVGSGEFTVIEEQEDLWVRPIPDVERSWKLDLRVEPEKKLSTGKAELGPDKKIIGARSEPGKEAADIIGTINTWSLGDYALFQVEKESVLRVRLKMDQPSWLNLIVVYRSAKTGSNSTATCLYQDEAWWKDLKPNEWRTIEIPLATPKGSYEHPPEAENIPLGWFGFGVSLGAGQEKRGLVVEQMWIE